MSNGEDMILEEMLKSFRHQVDGETKIHLKALVKCKLSMIDTVSKMGQLELKTPIEYSILGFIEILDAVLDAKPKIQIDILKGINKFVELLPCAKNDEAVNARRIAREMITEFIEYAGDVKE